MINFRTCPTHFLPAFLLCSVALVGAVDELSARQNGFSPGDVLPQFSAVDVEGNPRQSEEFRGKFVLLDLCTIWCEPCQAMAPDAGRVAEALNDNGVPFVYIQGLFENVFGAPSEQTDALLWQSEFGVDRDVVILQASGEPESDLHMVFGGVNTGAVPSLIFLAPDGTILSVEAGYRSPEDLVLAAATFAGAPVPVLPEGAPATLFPAESLPSIIVDATFELQIGDTSASSAPTFVDPEAGLGYDLSGMGLPFEVPSVGIESSIDDERLETWTIGFADVGKLPQFLDHGTNVFIRVASPQWQEDCVELAPTVATAEIIDSNFQFITPANPTINVTVDGEDIVVGPFSLESMGTDPLVDVIGFSLRLQELALHSEALSVESLRDQEIDAVLGSHVSLHAAANGSNLVFQWQKDGMDLTDGNGITGTNSSTLTFESVLDADDAYYGLLVSNGCRTVHSGFLRLDTLGQLGDVNRDSNINLLDVMPFINVLSEGAYQREADLNQDCAVNLLDVNFFIEALANP